MINDDISAVGDFFLGDFFLLMAHRDSSRIRKPGAVLLPSGIVTRAQYYRVGYNTARLVKTRQYSSWPAKPYWTRPSVR